jgi:uncharacterized membrane protein
VGKIGGIGMVLITLLVALFALLVVVLVCVVIYKMIVKKQNIHHYYSPFDTITGQTPVEFHEEKEEKVLEEKEGDDE